MQPIKDAIKDTHEEMSVTEPSRSDQTSTTEQIVGKEAFARIATLIEGAQSLPQIQAATEALRTWVREHPEDKERLSAIFSQLFLLEEGAREAAAEAEAMGLSDEERQQRERLSLLRRGVHGEDPPDVFLPALQQARRALEAWKRCHPEDPFLTSLSAHLDTEEEMAALLHPKV